MKSRGPVHAPKTGPGYSAGQRPPAVSKGSTAHPKASDGNSVRRNPADPKGAAPMSGGPKAGNHAAMRKPY